MRILGTATVSEGMKIVLISRIAKKFNTKKGDIIVFYENDEGDIIIRKGWETHTHFQWKIEILAERREGKKP